MLQSFFAGMVRRRRLTGWCWRAMALLGAVLATGCESLHHRHASSDEIPLPPPAVDVPAYVLEVGDELEIRFPFRPIVGDATMQRLQAPPQQTELVVVRDDGMISLPLIGSVPAAGLTPDELQQDLIARYQQIQYNPLEAGKSEIKRAYILSANDTLEIRFRLQPDMNETAVIRPDGRITLPIIKSVKAEGKTPEQLENELNELYAKQLKNPDVTVLVRDFTSNTVNIDGEVKQLGLRNVEGLTVIVRNYTRQVYITGEVNAPRPLPYKGPLSLSQAIVAAGGHKRSADLDKVMILRRATSGAPPTTLYVDMSTTLRGRGSNDVYLHHQDVVVVPKSHITRFTDVLEMYVYQVVPWTRNSPIFTFFYNLNPGASAGIINPNPSPSP